MGGKKRCIRKGMRIENREENRAGVKEEMKLEKNGLEEKEAR